MSPCSSPSTSPPTATDRAVHSTRALRMQHGSTPEQQIAYITKKWFPPSIPFRIKFAPEKGRHLIATRPILAGETILTCYPYTYFTYEETKKKVCLYCFEDRTDSNEELPFPCDKCHQVWYCTQECQQRDWDGCHRLECEAIRKWCLQVDWTDPSNLTEIKMYFRTLARRIQEKEKRVARDDPVKINFDDYSTLIANDGKWENSLIEALNSCASYTLTVASDMLIDGAKDKQFLLRMMLKNRNNMFNVFRSTTVSIGWAVYVEASFFNHSCQPNVCIFRNHRSRAFDFVAVHDIPADTELQISYLGAEEDLAERRKHLLDQYFFKCTCARCSEEEKWGVSESYRNYKLAYGCPVKDCVGFRLPRAGPDGKKEMICNFCSLNENKKANKVS